MIAHDRAQTGHARHDPFDAAAEAGKEVRFDEAGNNPQVRGEHVLVEQGRGAIEFFTTTRTHYILADS